MSRFGWNYTHIFFFDSNCSWDIQHCHDTSPPPPLEYWICIQFTSIRFEFLFPEPPWHIVCIFTSLHPVSSDINWIIAQLIDFLRCEKATNITVTYFISSSNVRLCACWSFESEKLHCTSAKFHLAFFLLFLVFLSFHVILLRYFCRCIFIRLEFMYLFDNCWIVPSEQKKMWIEKNFFVFLFLFHPISIAHSIFGFYSSWCHPFN